MVARTQQLISRHAIRLLRISIGLIYVWFGSLKFFPALSPAELLAEETIELLFFNLLEGHLAILILAGWEVLLGIAFLINYQLKVTVPLMFLHMLCTLVPAFVTPEDVFTHFPLGLTLVGQYIVKNFVLVTAALILLKEAQKASDTPGMKMDSGLK